MILVLLALAAAQPKCPDKTGNQGALNACAQIELNKSEAALKRQWRRTLKLAAAADAQFGGAGDQSNVEVLRASQKAWLAYREAECQVENAPSGLMGSLDRMSYLYCLAGMADERVKELRNLEKAYRD